MTASLDPSSLQTLNRLLTRLDRSLSPSSPATANSSHYKLAKTRSNIEYARTLLLTLEKQASTIRIQSQRQNVQADLAGKREVIKRLNVRVDQLEEDIEEAEDDDEDEDDDSEDESDSGAGVSYAPARSDALQNSGLDANGTGGEEHPGAQLAEALQQSTSHLRSRRPDLQASDNRSAASTTSRDQLFANRSPQPSDPSLSQSETLLSHNRTEQETLTTGLLGLARALKESSVNFGASLETEKEVLKRAEGGLDKNAQGMEAAEKKMGTLRKMSEGQGLLGRLKLYGMIAALWILCFLLVFIGPKLRL